MKPLPVTNPAPAAQWKRRSGPTQRDFHHRLREWLSTRQPGSSWQRPQIKRRKPLGL